MARKRKPKTAKAAVPNAGLEAAYRRKLDVLIKGMNDDIQRAVKSAYRKRESEITGDAKPSIQLTRIIDKIMKKWTKNFDDDANSIAKWLIKNSDSATRSQIGRSLAKATGMTVKFKTTKHIESMLDDLVAVNVDLIKSIPRQYHDQVNEAVLESVKAGRDLGGITNALDGKNGITRRRAAFIAKDQNNKATEAIGLERNKSLGITHGEWRHRSGSKQPRASHIAANGKIFPLDKGLMIEGRLLFPGEDYNCNCTFKPVLPDLDKKSKVWTVK